MSVVFQVFRQWIPGVWSQGVVHTLTLEHNINSKYLVHHTKALRSTPLHECVFAFGGIWTRLPVPPTSVTSGIHLVKLVLVHEEFLFYFESLCIMSEIFCFSEWRHLVVCEFCLIWEQISDVEPSVGFVWSCARARSMCRTRDGKLSWLILKTRTLIGTFHMFEFSHQDPGPLSHSLSLRWRVSVFWNRVTLKESGLDTEVGCGQRSPVRLCGINVMRREAGSQIADAGTTETSETSETAAAEKAALHSVTSCSFFLGKIFLWGPTYLLPVRSMLSPLMCRLFEASGFRGRHPQHQTCKQSHLE